ncbi:DUF488 family protein [Loigolactobacillus coryniformis]|jgi:uncharacterized protein YeaO (DUF488 family)|uniref:Uncharacterized protein n=1 Tax=Loigolactobacillus coryniformis subsp. torquens DSM 20004 = KCTC 3535 TaxID=1423822 RepID=A0A2D1KQW2_9LACO|nr:DUF488 family protein [Loigolactobacillus coryniformis]ATO44535.1 hypothetical protein LC20004_11760 [Loigolactobacillus coryniformis subsp. torquens DSM 20004 = KCTC 3535]KRK84991.1 hypothetical protein FC16_GL000429 [Loigolactobacillus coryniformis subsp. torquens DSM 20004 = KCTC 3535]MCL5458016.1 DUF488 family protein [Loigolactobacillus coryniformis]MDC4184727.1 DUF488 family protein [Loigolactobacillus coryniformis]
MQIKLERIYTKPADHTGYRILVDRLWPRGISKVNAALDDWNKEIAPSSDLRKWFNHDVAKYPEFRQRYLAELATNPATTAFLNSLQPHATVIFLFGAKDEQHNQAVVLKEYVEQKNNAN